LGEDRFLITCSKAHTVRQGPRIATLADEQPTQREPLRAYSAPNHYCETRSKSHAFYSRLQLEKIRVTNTTLL